MSQHNAQRVTVTIPPDMAEFLERYQAQTGVSRSEAMVRAVRALQEKNLMEEYAAYAQSGEFVDLETGDGFDPAEGQWWQ